MIDRRISAVWPHADDMDVLGLGQSEIYLQRLTPHARRVVSAAPAAQGSDSVITCPLQLYIRDKAVPFHVLLVGQRGSLW